MNHLTTYYHRKSSHLHAHKALNKAFCSLMLLCSYALICACVLSTYALYICSDITTNVKISLQIKLFMQNKAKFQKVKFYINKAKAIIYEQMDTWSIKKKQSQTKPNKPKSKKAKMNVSQVLTKDYEKLSNWAIYPKRTQFKPKQTQFYRVVAFGEDGSKRQKLPLLMTINARKTHTSPIKGPWPEFLFDFAGTLRHKGGHRLIL